MNPNHHKIAILYFQGFSAAEISRQLGYKGRSYVARVLQREDVRQLVKSMMSEFTELVVRLQAAVTVQRLASAMKRHR